MDNMNLKSVYKSWSDIGETIQEMSEYLWDDHDLTRSLNMVLCGCQDAIRDLSEQNNALYDVEMGCDPETLKKAASCMTDAIEESTELDGYVNDLKQYAQTLQKHVGVLLLNIEQLSVLNRLILPLSKGLTATAYALYHPYEAVEVGVLEEYPANSYDSHDMFQLVIGHAIAKVTALRTVTEQVAGQFGSVTDRADFEELLEHMNEGMANTENTIDVLKEKLETAMENLQDLKSHEVSRCDTDD